ncbi:MAG: PASTA domain-containing protein [Bacteroidota bacterium]
MFLFANSQLPTANPKEVFKFITRRHFLINLLAAIILVIGLMFLFLWSLGFITNHGDFEKVPGVKGKLMNEAKKALEAKGFKVEVQDSLYIDTLAAFAVIKQSPEGEMMVKGGRVVYLTVNRSTPPLVEMPNMVGFSFRNAEMYMRQLGLKLGDTTRKPDIARDAVLEQLYKGQQIKAGTKIYQGSTISFVLGNGLGEEEFDVPVVTAMTFKEASAMLRGMNLNWVIVTDADVKDTANAIVYRQFPNKKTVQADGSIQENKIREGQSIDLYLSKTMKEDIPGDAEETKDTKSKKPTAPKKEKKPEDDY